MANIFILGAGSFGVSLAIMFSKYNHNITLYARNPQKCADMDRTRICPLLPKKEIPKSITIQDNFNKIEDAEIILIAVPTHSVRSIAKEIKPIINSKTPIVCLAKGFEDNSLKRMSEVLSEELDNDLVAMSGPTHAEELASGIPSTIVAASDKREIAEFIQDKLSNSTLRIYVSDDVMGVELGGALKNVIALSAGALDGKGLGDNTKAALMTRGIIEITRLGVACGAKSETFTGLSGIGDLIVTCTSLHSRNRRAGILIGEGKTADEAIKEIGMVVEGYKCAKNAYKLAEKYNVEMPIITQVYKILYENKPMDKAIEDLMDRPKRHESEMVWKSENKEK